MNHGMKQVVPASARTFNRGDRGSVRTVPIALALVAALVVTLAPVAVAQPDPNQVTGLTAVQEHGFTTLRWNEVAGATDYQITRTPVNDANEPTGTEVQVGVWRPNRQTPGYPPTFAEAGYAPGDRFAWRVRARFGTTAQAYSDSVYGTTLPPWGDPSHPGAGLRTQWEETLGVQFTSDVNEYAYTAALDAASDRVRVVEIGRTLQNRPVNLIIVGYPAPPGTAAEIAAEGSAVVNCNVHGNEPSSREACLIMARELAFSDDPRIVAALSQTTFMFVPSINGDGRAANTRGNNHGNQDLNRDHSLLREPETFAFASMVRDYQPRASFDGHEYGNNTAGDLPVLPPRHLNVAQEIFDQSQDMIQNHLYDVGSANGWWYCPYGCQGGATVGMSEETILRNTLGLKNTVNSLLEARSGGGATRPNEGNAANNRRRKTYSALYTYHQFLDYYVANADAVEEARNASIAFQISNTGRIVWRGTRPIPAFPAPHPGESPPNNQAVTGSLEEPPCGYRLTDAQVNGARSDSDARFPTTVGQRMAAHGWTVEQQGDTYLVRLNQPQRGLIPLLLDGAATEPWVSGERLFDAEDCVTVLSIREELDRLVAAGGITPSLEAKIRHALDMFEEWIQNPRQRGPALSHLDRAIRLLEWQADVVDRTGKPQGDPAGLRALAATIRTLWESYQD